MIHITSCHDLIDYLSEYVDGELENQAICEEIESHLTDCEDCRVVVDTLEKTVYLYREAAKNAVAKNADTEVSTIPADVRDRLFSRLDLGEFLE